MQHNFLTLNETEHKHYFQHFAKGRHLHLRTRQRPLKIISKGAIFRRRCIYTLRCFVLIYLFICGVLVLLLYIYI